MREGKGKGKGKNTRAKKPFRRKKRRPCLFCEGKTMTHKDLFLLRRFVSDRGKVLPTRSSGCCAKHQRIVTKMIKRARQAGLIPYTVD